MGKGTSPSPPRKGRVVQQSRHEERRKGEQERIVSTPCVRVYGEYVKACGRSPVGCVSMLYSANASARASRSLRVCVCVCVCVGICMYAFLRQRSMHIPRLYLITPPHMRVFRFASFCLFLFRVHVLSTSRRLLLSISRFVSCFLLLCALVVHFSYAFAIRFAFPSSLFVLVFSVYGQRASFRHYGQGGSILARGRSRSEGRRAVRRGNFRLEMGTSTAWLLLSMLRVLDTC